MCSHKPPLLKSHNKPKISFKIHFTKNVLKTWSTRTTLTYNIIQFKPQQQQNVLKEQPLRKPRKSTIIVV